MSNTVCIEAVFLTALIGSYKERAVVCFDIPGAYLNS